MLVIQSHGQCSLSGLSGGAFLRRNFKGASARSVAATTFTCPESMRRIASVCHSSFWWLRLKPCGCQPAPARPTAHHRPHYLKATMNWKSNCLWHTWHWNTQSSCSLTWRWRALGASPEPLWLLMFKHFFKSLFVPLQNKTIHLLTSFAQMCKVSSTSNHIRPPALQVPLMPTQKLRARQDYIMPWKEKRERRSLNLYGDQLIISCWSQKKKRPWYNDNYNSLGNSCI